MLKLSPSPTLYVRLVAIWIVLSIGGITAALITWQKLDASFNDSMRLRQLRHAVEDAQDDLQDGESAQRGFLLTDDEQYLAPFARAERTLPSKLQRLEGLAQDDAELTRHVGELRLLAEAKMTEMRRMITVRQTQGATAALALVMADRGSDTMNQIRDLLDRFDQRLRLIATERNNETDADLKRALITTLVGGVVGLAAGILALYLSQLAVKREAEARTFAERLIATERGAMQKSTFLANMSHEIRTPMTAILGFSELLANDLPEKGKSLHFANSIRESALALLQLINDILDVAKLDVGMVVLHPEPADLQDILDFVATIFSQQMALKSLNFRITQGPGIPRSLLLDRSRLRQILINLVNNSLKFTETGDVTVHADWEPDYTDRNHGTLLFEISDTGIGIPEEKWETIFDPFVQVDSVRMAERQGSGLGLSIVKRLTERMGGTVILQNSSGKGSTFRVRLPNVAISRKAPSSLAESPVRVDFNELAPSTILVVDDNSLNRELLGEMFHGTHHTVYFATNGREAVDSVRSRCPDVVLMDISMPSLDGRRALEEIRKLPASISLPVIAITASSLRDEEIALRSSFSGYVRKPFTRRQLFQGLVDQLGTRAHPLAAPVSQAVAIPASNSKNPLLASPAERWLQLVEVLHKLETTRWPAVRDSGAINETKAFARELEALGRSSVCPILVTYGEQMHRAAEDYSVVQLENRLNEYPQVILAIAREADPSLA